MKHLRVIALVMMGVLMTGFSPPVWEANLSAEAQEVLQRGIKFSAVDSVKKLPPSVVALCADSRGKLADIGGAWEATDMIGDENLPRRRLIWAVVDGTDYLVQHDTDYIVHFEFGGIGHGYMFLIARVDAKGNATALWEGLGRSWEGPRKNEVADVAALARAIADKQVMDNPYGTLAKKK